MTTLKQVKKAAAALGAIVEEDKCEYSHECRVTAPHRKIWCDGVHEFVDCANRPWKPDYEDLLNRMSYGLEDCIDPDCDWCNS